MAMNSKDKIKFLLIILALLIPVWAITPMGYRSMHESAVRGKSQGWMDLAIFICGMTLRTETRADYLRESFLLWPNEAHAGSTLFQAAQIYYDLGTTAEKSQQGKLYTQAYDIYSRIQGKGDFDQIEAKLVSGETITYPLKGLLQGDKAAVQQKLEMLKQYSTRNNGVAEWEDRMLEQHQFNDHWNAKEIKP